MIPYATKFRIAEGNETDFANRVMFGLLREAVYRLNGGATGQDAAACRGVCANVSNFRFPITIWVLADQFFTTESVDALNAVPDTGANSIEAAVGAQWQRFVDVFFPAAE